MALGSTQPLTEMSTRNISWGVKAAGAKGWPYQFYVPIVLKCGNLSLLEPLGPVQACNGIALPLPFTTPWMCTVELWWLDCRNTHNRVISFKLQHIYSSEVLSPVPIIWRVPKDGPNVNSVPLQEKNTRGQSRSQALYWMSGSDLFLKSHWTVSEKVNYANCNKQEVLWEV